MLPFLLLAVVATVQAQLPGSCNFEADTCGYTSDPLFTSWTLNPEGNFITVDSVQQQGKEVRGGEEGSRESAGRRGGEEKRGGEEGRRESTGSRAVLLSPVMGLEVWSCLRLVYQVSGSGSLQVQQRLEGQSFDRPLWNSHTPSDSWVIASVDLHNTTEDWRVVLEGWAGDAPDSSVAVFEIRIIPGFCLECDYEDSHLCGYGNQWNTNVNWYVGGGVARDPDSTLPDDHTHNNGTGHYMYVDSVYAKTFKEVAKLSSPMTTVPMSGCLSFQYQRGEERGNLFSVYTRDQSGQYQDLWRADADETSWSAGTWEWIPVQVDLKAPYPLQVVFEVTFNSPRGGHVALDDISFSPDFCSAETEPTFEPAVANCDFEHGFCRYSQDQHTDSSPWKRVSVRPNIYRAGDHTTGAGSFLLAHSRLGPRTGYVSRLFGPVLPGNMKYCLRFYYSLRGFNQTDQALEVYLQDQASASLDRIWTQGERSRGIWVSSDVTFQIAQPAKVMFVSTCRSFWDCGTAALDDITVSLGDCDLTAVPGALLSVPGHCDFEAGVCGYTQDRAGDAGDWVRNRGPTPTSYTGPRGDHTTGLGYYMHIEASPMMSGQNVRLLSSSLRGARGPQCLRFYHHMYGSGTGQLRVLLSRDGEETLLWKRGGEQSITWLRATVEYQCDHQHQIVFEATRGPSVRSDIAIDDVVFQSGSCPEIEIQTGHVPSNSNDIE
ncbi:MAM domain-containing protein 2-like [Osmerus mordax]|uniref:MAM domain-containing protein 2-like n=1 Tax=Osmerus mordax TaxID=8014 RepID=UPI00350FA38C